MTIFLAGIVLAIALQNSVAVLPQDSGDAGHEGLTEEGIRRLGVLILADCLQCWRETLPRNTLLRGVDLNLECFDQYVMVPSIGRCIWPEELLMYCPAARTIYMCPHAFVDVVDRHGVAVLAVALAHEVGHHVQHCCGHQDRYDGLWQRGEPPTMKQVADFLRLYELQADAMAGYWYAATMDRDEARGWTCFGANMSTAEEWIASLGDAEDSECTAMLHPHPHGTAAQRRAAFKAGSLSELPVGVLRWPPGRDVVPFACREH